MPAFRAHITFASSSLDSDAFQALCRKYYEMERSLNSSQTDLFYFNGVGSCGEMDAFFSAVDDSILFKIKSKLRSVLPAFFKESNLRRLAAVSSFVFSIFLHYVDLTKDAFFLFHISGKFGYQPRSFSQLGTLFPLWKFILFSILAFIGLTYVYKLPSVLYLVGCGHLSAKRKILSVLFLPMFVPAQLLRLLRIDLRRIKMVADIEKALRDTELHKIRSLDGRLRRLSSQQSAVEELLAKFRDAEVLIESTVLCSTYGLFFAVYLDETLRNSYSPAVFSFMGVSWTSLALFGISVSKKAVGSVAAKFKGNLSLTGQIICMLSAVAELAHWSVTYAVFIRNALKAAIDQKILPFAYSSIPLWIYRGKTRPPYDVTPDGEITTVVDGLLNKPHVVSNQTLGFMLSLAREFILPFNTATKGSFPRLVEQFSSLEVEADCIANFLFTMVDIKILLVAVGLVLLPKLPTPLTVGRFVMHDFGAAAGLSFMRLPAFDWTDYVDGRAPSISAPLSVLKPWILRFFLVLILQRLLFTALDGLFLVNLAERALETGKQNVVDNGRIREAEILASMRFLVAFSTLMFVAQSALAAVYFFLAHPWSRLIRQEMGLGEGPKMFRAWRTVLNTFSR